MITATPPKTITKDNYPSRQRDWPSILERKDPIVYAQGDELPVGLSDKQVADYECKGFTVVNDLFTESEIETYSNDLAALTQASEIRNRPEAITEPDSQELRSLFAFHQIDSGLKHLATDPRLTRIARYLLNDDIYIHQSRLNLKQGFRGKGFYWHSDFETWHVEDGMPRMRALSMSVALTCNTLYNGSLMLIPGSHRSFVTCVGETPRDNYKNSLKNQHIGVPSDEILERLYADGGIEVPVSPPGSVTIFDCNTMHGSSNNISPLPRSNAFIVFNAVTNQLEAPFCSRAPRPNFIANRDDFRAIG